MTRNPRVEMAMVHNAVFGVENRSAATLLAWNVERARVSLLAGHFEAYRRAAVKGDITGLAEQLARMSATIDQTALAYGIDLDAVLAEVHRSDMSYVVDGTVTFDDHGVPFKPNQWVAPNLSRVLGLDTPDVPKATGKFKRDKEPTEIKGQIDLLTGEEIR